MTFQMPPTYLVEPWNPTGYAMRYRVLEFYGAGDRRNRFTKGRFHTREQAQDWAESHVVKRVLASLNNRWIDPRRNRLRIGSVYS